MADDYRDARDPLLDFFSDAVTFRTERPLLAEPA